MIKKYIEERKQGCYTKSHFLFNDKRVQLTIYECIFFSRDNLLVCKLSNAVKNYLGL